MITLADVREAVNASCTCGGGEPGACCPACEVWHRLRALGQRRAAARFPVLRQYLEDGEVHTGAPGKSVEIRDETDRS
jgi:hypothetical protein